jgi:hypothetical protein
MLFIFYLACHYFGHIFVCLLFFWNMVWIFQKADLKLFLFIFIFLLLCWVHCGIYKSSYNVSNIILEFTPSTIPFYPPPPIPGIVSTGLIFPFTNTCTQYLFHIHPSPPPTGTTLPGRTCSAFLFSNFVKEKKKTFLLIYDSYTGRFLVTFPCIYML